MSEIKKGLISSLGAQAQIFIKIGDIKQALKLLKEHEKLCIEIRDDDALIHGYMMHWSIFFEGKDKTIDLNDLFESTAKLLAILERKGNASEYKKVILTTGGFIRREEGSSKYNINTDNEYYIIIKDTYYAVMKRLMAFVNSKSKD
jgi:hypothetical protein